MSACGRSGKWQQALEVCKRMTDNGVGPDLVTHNTILSAFKTGGQPHLALAFYKHLVSKNVPVDRFSHNIILSCLTKLGHYDDAIKLFFEMRKMNGCKPDVITFNSLLHVYAVCGQVTKARDIFDMMIGENLFPDPSVCPLVAKGYHYFRLSLSKKWPPNIWKRN